MAETMIISPIEADLKRDTDTFGKMEVYCVFKLGENSQKTTNSRGTNPSWDGQEFEF